LAGDAVIDLGCGSGRLFRPFLDGGARRIVGVDGSPDLVRRAERRIAADDRLAALHRRGMLELVVGDVREVERADRFDMAVMAGVLAHLDGPDEAAAALSAASQLLAQGGIVIVDGLGPGGLPRRDLPLSTDWRRTLDGRPVTRRSRLVREERPDGLHVVFSTLIDIERADGTIARLPADYRLWYPSPEVLLELVQAAGLEVQATYGSHDLEPLGPDSDRCIVVAGREAPVR
jgi:SAM-dependent methyltransferase